MGKRLLDSIGGGTNEFEFLFGQSWICGFRAVFKDDVADEEDEDEDEGALADEDAGGEGKGCVHGRLLALAIHPASSIIHIPFTYTLCSTLSTDSLHKFLQLGPTFSFFH